MGLRYDAILGRVRETDENGGGGVQAPAPIVAAVPPTSAAEGAVGQLYVDTSTAKTYHCTSVTVDDTDPENPVTTYTWVDDINAKGGIIQNGTLIVWNGASGYTRLGYGVLDFTGSNLITGATYGTIYLGEDCSTSWEGRCILAGAHLRGQGMGMFVCAGAYNRRLPKSGIRYCVGNGSSDGARHNTLEIFDSGKLYHAGAYQQGITEIPADTSAYTLVEGCFMHAPASAPTYTLPDVSTVIEADYFYFTRDTTLDGTGYYGWTGGGFTRYTASATPAVGDNTYANTALTQNARAITAIDRRTHECILTVRFSSTALSVAFQDAAGNAIAPLPLAGTIADGSVVAYRCTYEELLGRWVIMPVMLGAYSAGV